MTAKSRLTAMVLSMLAVAVGSAPISAAAQESPSIDRLYSLPRISGTAPSQVVWSSDATRIAFLWNDEGREFRDVWVAAVDDPTPRRLTSFPRPALPEPADIESLRARERGEQERGVGDLLWFPDGNSLLASFGGDFYRVRLDGTEPERLGRAGRRPAFSPDGRLLAVVAGAAVQVVELSGSAWTPRTVLEFDGDRVGVGQYEWSPDGERFAVVERDMSGVPERLIPDYLTEETSVHQVTRAFPGEEPGRTRLWVVDAASGDRMRMDLGPDDRDLLFTVQWSSGGRRLLVDKSDLYVEDRRLLALDPRTGAAELLYREAEPDNVMAFWQAAWAGDGEGVWFLSDRDDFYHLYFLSGAGAEPVAITRGNWAVESFAVHGDVIDLVGNREHPSRRDLYRVPLSGGEPVRLSERSGTHEPVYSPSGRHAAVLFSNDDTPPDLFLNDLGEQGERRVTESPLPAFHELTWVTPEYVTFESHVDGATIHGRLSLPPGFDPRRRYPAIIGSIYSNTLRNQWGGRNAHPLWGLDHVLLSRGYVLLNVNIRGSWGLGREFRRRMQRDYGGIDVEDILSGVHYLESLGYVDMDRVGLWGSSYGGLMTAMSLFTHPGVYAAGVAGAPATNVWHAMTGEMRVMDRPQDYPEEYADSSPFTKVGGLQDPLMIVHGMRDSIVLFKDSLVLLEHAMLRGKGHLVEFVPLPNAPHGWDTAELYQTRYAFRKMIEFFDRHLQPASR